jgi:hypothetical protein
MAIREGDRIGLSLIGGDYWVKWVGERMVSLFNIFPMDSCRR